MRPASQLLFALLIGLLSIPTLAQTATPSPQPPVRDAQALAALQQAITAMGGTAPTDSVAKGSITLTAGSRMESGTFTLLTRGFQQSSEQIAATFTNQAIVYSNGLAARVDAQVSQSLPWESSVSSQSAIFPLPFLVNALSDANLNCRNFGVETTASSSFLHVQFWHGFANVPKLQFLASSTVVDAWLDPVTYLPKRISYQRRDAGGDAPVLRIDVFFSDYKNFGGILYPMSVQESLNGTPWASITLQSIALNTGLSDSSFPVE